MIESGMRWTKVTDIVLKTINIKWQRMGTLLSETEIAAGGIKFLAEVREERSVGGPPTKCSTST